MLVRERGWFDAKNAVADDASVLLAAADRALVIREEEEAERAAALAEAEAAAAAEAAGEEAPAAPAPVSAWSAPAAPKAAAVPAGPVGSAIDAIKRSPIMLELAPSAKGLSAVSKLVSACWVLVLQLVPVLCVPCVTAACCYRLQLLA